MSNSTLARIGINDGECKPGRSKELGGADVSDVSGSSRDAWAPDWEHEGGSEAVEGVEGEVVFREEISRTEVDVSERRGVVSRRWGVEREAKPVLRRTRPGIGGVISSPCSACITLVHMCRQISSDRRGPGSSGTSRDAALLGHKLEG
jgi:hypothetical protein